MNRLSRSTALRIAAVLSLILGIGGFITLFPYLAQGAAAFDPAAGDPFYFIFIFGLIAAVLRVIGSLGAWNAQRWGILLTIVINAIDSVLAAPGIFFAPSMDLWIAAFGGVIVSIIVITLCLWRDGRATRA